MPNCCHCTNYYHLNQLWDFEIDHAMYLTIDTTEAPEAAVTIKERMFFSSTVHRMDTNGASICVTPVHRRSSGLRCSSQVPWTTKSGTRSPTRLETKMCGHDEHVQCFVKRMCFVGRFKGEHVQCIAQNLTKTVMVHSEWKI